MNESDAPNEPPDQPTSDEVRAAGILFIHGTAIHPIEFLLMRHADRWDLPKGHCDGDETFLETAIREVAEETGMQRGQYELDPHFSFDLEYPVSYPDQGEKIFHKRVRFYLAFVDEKIPLRLTEHQGSQWMDWAPPHDIQPQTINPLLAAVAMHLTK